MNTHYEEARYPVTTCTKSFEGTLPSMLRSVEPTLASVLSYSNDAVIARFCKEFGLPKPEAVLLFDDLKRFLWVSATVDNPIAPPPAIDDAWHVFLLFTRDYQTFCEVFFGRFLHHRPQRPDDLPDGGKAIRGMVKAIKMHLGGYENLSPNWRFSDDKPADCYGEGCTSSDSVSCAPSTSD